MKKQIVTLLVPLSLLALPAMSFAAVTGTGTGGGTATSSATGTLIATATVSAKCVVDSTTNVVFGSVDPTTNGNYDGVGTIVTHCSKGTLEFLFVAPSTGGSSLRMTSPTSTDTITYALYSDASRTTAFPSVTGGTKTTQPGTAVTTTIYGRVVVAKGVNDTVASGSDYTQSLTATIEW
jgi:spore coat protein U-like protein